MSYEYKELIEQAIIDDDRPLDWEEGFKELDEVYAKARAFDDILKVFESAPTKEYTFGGNGRDKEYKFPENIDVDKWWRELREENK